MGRRYYLECLMRFFNIKWMRYAIKAGKDSGYPNCCITMFFVRAFFMDLYGIITGDVGPFKGEVRSFRTNLELRQWQQSTEYKRKAKHIVCPWHRLIYFLTKKEHQYMMCKECAWIQFEKHDCNNCAQDDFYQTKERRKNGNVRLSVRKLPKLRNKA